MKTEYFRNRIEELKKIKQDNLEKFVNPLTKQILELKDKMYKNIVLNKEYIADLSEYNGKEISFIALDSNGEDVWLPTDEIVSVENGRLYLSSYQGGMVRYDNEKQKYIKSYFRREEELNIVGFVDIKIID
jgi:phosphoenolpyruvate synthase/pyruvate phosphate dikinase